MPGSVPPIWPVTANAARRVASPYSATWRPVNPGGSPTELVGQVVHPGKHLADVETDRVAPTTDRSEHRQLTVPLFVGERDRRPLEPCLDLCLRRPGDVDCSVGRNERHTLADPEPHPRAWTSGPIDVDHRISGLRGDDHVGVDRRAQRFDLLSGRGDGGMPTDRRLTEREDRGAECVGPVAGWRST